MKPALVIRPIFAPLRSSTALVAIVVPCRKRAMSSAATPRSRARCVMAFSTAWLGSPRVVGIFIVRIGAPARRQTISVKVPPISTPISTAGAGLGMRGAVRLQDGSMPG